MRRAEAAGSVALERQWRTVRIGAAIVAAALALTYVVLPFARHWQAREHRLAEAREHLQQLSTVVTNRAAIDSLVQLRESALASQPTRVLRARSRSLAASALQSLVQELADISRVTVTRLEVTNSAVTSDVPITLSANGDIYGLTELLQQFRHGRYVVVVDKLVVQVNSALRGAPDVLQMTLSLHAPVLVE